MKKILIIMLLSLSLNLFSQEYHPFAEQNASWSLNNSSWEPTFDYHSVLVTAGDTTINNLIYTKVLEFMPDWYNNSSQDTIIRLFALYRQNIEEKKVYIIRQFLNETTEKLLYNFDENAEQPMSLPGLENYYYSPDTLFNLEQVVDVSLYDGSIRKKYQLRSVSNDWIVHNVIEGIGNESNPFGTGVIILYPEDYGEVVVHLTCYSDSDQILYVEGDPNDCGQILLRTQSPTMNSNELFFFPNPANDIVTFELPRPNYQYHVIIITNVSGKIIETISLGINQSSCFWDCSTVASGVYFYQTEIAGEVYRGKIVVN